MRFYVVMGKEPETRARITSPTSKTHKTEEEAAAGLPEGRLER